MPDINELGLAPEDVGPIDYDAPESGSFPPQLNVGTFTFVFNLEEDPFDKVEITGEDKVKRPYLQIQHIAKTEIQEPSPADPNLMIPKEVELRFQRVNTYKHSKMPNSSFGDLMRALNIRFSGVVTPQVIEQELRQIDGRVSYQAEVGWRAYCKTDEIEISTSARKKKIKSGDQAAWPKDANGNFLEMAECPKCKTKMYGNAEIVRYKLPQAADAQPV